MKKITLWKKLIAITAGICTLFFVGIALTQTLSEESIVKASNKEGIEAAIQEAQEEFERTESMSVQEYYVNYLGYDPRITADFEQKYALDATQVIMKDITNEKFDYLMAVTALYENSEQPILSRNEQKENGQVVIGENGEVAYSLETLSSDVAALSDSVDSETPIIEICKKYDIDPDGKVGDLTPAIIMEINQKLFEISDHPE